MEDKRREEILDIINREFIGPDPGDSEEFLQENGEEILRSHPNSRYISGILFAQKTQNPDVEPDDTVSEYHDDQVASDEDDEFEEVLNLSNAFRQSAVSMTLCIGRDDDINIEVYAARYEPRSTKPDDESKQTTRYYRIPIYWDNAEEKLTPPSKKERIFHKDIQQGEESIGLRFHVALRHEDEERNLKIITLSLENTNEENSEQGPSIPHFYQTGFRVTAEKGFHPLPDYQENTYQEQDRQTNDLLYRHKQCFAIGHGCSAQWAEEDNIYSIETSFIPSYEVKPIIPNSIDGVELDMKALSDINDGNEGTKNMNLLADRYEQWINKIEADAQSLDNTYRETALRHVEECKAALNRIRRGIEILNQDEEVAQAFQFMNRAMLEQQLRHKLPIQEWGEDNGQTVLKNKVDVLPDINDESTWYNTENMIYGKWYPFQLAFILMNVESIADVKSKERELVDLIWFPTGGGKTEAYLGLSAFSIFLRRLRNPEDSGTDIIMRYTLRLLTAQQYERASSLICACELIRRENKEQLGTKSISIGLWIGGSSTPNTLKQAVEEFDDLYRSKTSINPFPIHRCPRCSARMGPVHVNQKAEKRIIGFERVKKNILFVCGNEAQGCEFSNRGTPLPMHVIDEDIYQNRPTFILGTVDKFATLPFQKDSRKLFGKDDDTINPPSLIIQDELHLISGPLGSMVGHYETLIDHLSTKEVDGAFVKPKIIASTATISRAKEQCNALYAREQKDVFLFPPQGLNEGESFFARKANERNGRLYTGLMVSGETSQATAAIRLYASLLYAGKALDVEAPDEKDPYWTNVAYFNSIRELGQMATWIRQDIKEYLDIIYKRKGSQGDQRRINDRNILELTSRTTGDEISNKLHELETRYTGEKGNYPADIALATNMISVGLDVSRLGLMTVNGQPKTTAEYIQATSRVGRDPKNAPGIIFTIYNPGRPRDRSHYEQFQYYHSRLYAEVEPTSVTPFSEPVLERALPAVIIGMMRLSNQFSVGNEKPTPPSTEDMETVMELVSRRVAVIDDNASGLVKDQIKYIIDKWKNESFSIYMDHKYNEEKLPLMVLPSKTALEKWQGRPFSVPSSMRTVDASCQVKILSRYND